MSAIFNSGSAKCAALLSKTAWVTLLALSSLFQSAISAEKTESPYERAQRLLRSARQQWAAEPKNPEWAWQVSRACFDAAEFASTDTRRAEHATQGIDAARKALGLNPRMAAAHYYLGMNLGQLARTKKLGALKLVDELESSFHTVVGLNPGFDFGGAHRCLGLLYRDAPGWPISVGNRGKARLHLLKAVELAPEYPDNWLALIEAYLSWGDKERARTQFQLARTHLEAARQRFTGDHWKTSWEDWDKRLAEIRGKLHGEKLESPKAR